MDYQIEAVSVCVGYADFLAETCRYNRQFFSEWVIVTTPEDEDTLKVCHYNNLRAITTNDFSRNGRASHDGPVFNKGRGVQRGFDAISAKCWVLHIDADIVLPPEFPHALQMAHPSEKKIYGCDRQQVVGWDAWSKIKQNGHRQHGMHHYVRPHDSHPIMTRWAGYPNNGYVPIGFFQLMHGSSLTRNGIWHRGYPAHHNQASRSDVQFALQWDRRDRELIPELFVWHLESEESPVGKNWNGRKSKPFGPDEKAVDPMVANMRFYQ